jgi:hypothetical protein
MEDSSGELQAKQDGASQTEKYRVAFANLRLAVEREGHEWRVRVCDLSGRETLHVMTRQSLADAQAAAVHFALARLFGPSHNKDSARMAASLAWGLVAEG